MPVRHIAMFSFNDDAPSDIAGRVTDALTAMAPNIDTLRDYRFGPDLGLADGNFEYAVVAEFDDVAGWERYRDNPEHQRIIADLIKPNISNRAAAQYEI